ncbi:MAG: undecaprenyl-diphosphate phosphatase [Candidatus Marinimicrobia bacterium]|nr:undecaprenyl-diphosphate phosphatase [Candidatus Neomarinimicrobiota bacterium]MCF7829818.1 undecaprenyl-diphosphate phosphatase [Candidatus Neomarinimicrobiota bacterium]MCF7881749.1 undecaprenyl-diphosphate phosphatase [Candidatus Neomarinimicrobiota bacterium]
MELTRAIFLGVIQGLTEFLPISSSGHLALAQALFGRQATGLVFEVFVHFGTVVSVLVAFRKDISEILGALFRGIIRPGEWHSLWANDPDFRMNWMILIGIIPAGVIGFVVEDLVDQAFGSPVLVGFMLIGTALILWSSRFAVNQDADLNWKKSIAVGFAQALAIIPGISRSGTTITAGMWLKLNPERAAKFSFFLAIPVILGASLIKFIEILQTGIASAALWPLVAGTLAAFLSGWIAIVFLMDLLRKGKFSWFAIYCGFVGVLTIIISMVN